MENDTIRSSGNSTLVDLWVEGKMRAVKVSRAAIEEYAGRTLSEDECSDFVRKNLSLVMAAAKERLRETGPSASTVVIEAGQLGSPPGERRRTDRRKGERRKADRPQEIPPGGDRRRASRRKTDRRTRKREG